MNKKELSEVEHNKEELAGLQAINKKRASKPHPLLMILSFGTLGLLAAVIILVFFWEVYPYKMIDYKGDYIMEHTSYVQGEESFYVTTYCKHTDLTPAIKKEFVDGLVFTSDSPQAFFTKGCRTQEQKINIPHTLPPGRYRLKITTEYKVNPVRTVEYVHYSNWFIVKENTTDVFTN